MFSNTSVALRNTIKIISLTFIAIMISYISYSILINKYPHLFVTSQDIIVPIGYEEGPFRIIVCKINVDCEADIENIYAGVRSDIEKYKGEHISIQTLNHKLCDQVSKKFWKTKVIIPLQDHENARGLFVLGYQDSNDANLSNRKEYYRINIIMGKIGEYLFFNTNTGSSWPYNKGGMDSIVRTIIQQILTGKNKHQNCGICTFAQIDNKMNNITDII